jgi:hypothetical protein
LGTGAKGQTTVGSPTQAVPTKTGND